MNKERYEECNEIHIDLNDAPFRDYIFGNHKGVRVHYHKSTDTVILPRSVFERILSFMPSDMDKSPIFYAINGVPVSKEDFEDNK